MKTKLKEEEIKFPDFEKELYPTDNLALLKYIIKTLKKDGFPPPFDKDKDDIEYYDNIWARDYARCYDYFNRLIRKGVDIKDYTFIVGTGKPEIVYGFGYLKEPIKTLDDQIEEWFLNRSFKNKKEKEKAYKVAKKIILEFKKQRYLQEILSKK